MRILLHLTFPVFVGCAVVSPEEVTGDWRFDTEDGSWVRLSFDEDGTGQKTTWHAENKGGLENDFYWEVRGAKVSIREIMFLDDLGAAEIFDEARLEVNGDGTIQLVVKNYNRPFTREK